MSSIEFLRSTGGDGAENMGPITRPLAMTWKATGQMDCEVWLFYWYLSLPKTPLADHQRNKTCSAA